MTHSPVCTIIPPQISDALAKAGTAAQKEAAARAKALMARIRAKRSQLAPVPGEPDEGEQREIRDAKHGTTKGTVVRKEDQAPTADQTVNEAYDGLGNTFRLYKEVFHRDSLDGHGMLMRGVVHVDRDFDNAYWDGTDTMWFGDGSYFNPFTRDLTVTGHELTHGVTQFTAGLVYQDQPGALNEHISDVFGALVEQYAYRQTAEQATWLIGALLCQGKIQGRALRDMVNPGTAYDDPVIGKDPQGADMAHYDHSSEDNGGVHINSGIPNRAFALAAKAAGGYAWETVGKVWYTVLTEQLHANAQFPEFAALTYQTAGTLFPNSAIQAAVQHGWETVGIPVTGPVPQPPTPPTSPCAPEILALLQDRDFRTHVSALLKLPGVRRLIARARVTPKLI